MKTCEKLSSPIRRGALLPVVVVCPDVVQECVRVQSASVRVAPQHRHAVRSRKMQEQPPGALISALARCLQPMSETFEDSCLGTFLPITSPALLKGMAHARRQMQRMGLRQWMVKAADTKAWNAKLDAVLDDRRQPKSPEQTSKERSRRGGSSSPPGRSGRGRSGSPKRQGGGSGATSSASSKARTTRHEWDPVHSSFPAAKPQPVFASEHEVIERAPPRPVAEAVAAPATSATPLSTSESKVEPGAPSSAASTAAAAAASGSTPAAAPAAAGTPSSAPDVHSTPVAPAAPAFYVAGRPLYACTLPEGAVAVPVKLGVAIGSCVGAAWNDPNAYFAVEDPVSYEALLPLSPSS